LERFGGISFRPECSALLIDGGEVDRFPPLREKNPGGVVNVPSRLGKDAGTPRVKSGERISEEPLFGVFSAGLRFGFSAPFYGVVDQKKTEPFARHGTPDARRPEAPAFYRGSPIGHRGSFAVEGNPRCSAEFPNPSRLLSGKRSGITREPDLERRALLEKPRDRMHLELGFPVARRGRDNGANLFPSSDSFVEAGNRGEMLRSRERRAQLRDVIEEAAFPQPTTKFENRRRLLGSWSRAHFPPSDFARASSSSSLRARTSL
jgi:hypothetical protein